ncbi:MAG TPA: beta-galactosidase GalA [Opitutaceae bacterium]|nr:beta-galactosidase GalA [Opitutaceae bacterium]
MPIALFQSTAPLRAFIRPLTRAFFATACGAASLLVAAAESPRGTQPLDSDWRFHRGEAPAAVFRSFDDREWRRVDVPHDYVVEGTFAEGQVGSRAEALRPDWFWLHGFLPLEPAVYRKTFSIPAQEKGRHLWLEFDGVANNSLYWVNGTLIGSQYSGYTRSRFDITAVANPGAENTIVVQMDPRYEGWWYEGGGIYRHVRLISVDPVHIAPDGVFVAPAVADPGEGVEADATLAVKTRIENTGVSSVDATIVSEILDAGGRALASDSSVLPIAAGESVESARSIALTKARLWSPEIPALYSLRSTVTVAGKVVDRVTTQFGVRHIRFDADRGFFLNGKPVQFRGVNIHQDHAGVGVAVPDRLFTWRLERLKEVGCNAIRLSHNPVTPFLLEECDRLGFLVIAENRNFGDVFTDQAPEDAAAEDLRDLNGLILRDRNHPSIILWSICNEQWIGGTPGAARIARALKKRVRELDPTRPVTAAMNGGFDSLQGMIGELDVVGINYNTWAYDPVHKLFPKTPMIASEIASEISTRGVYRTDKWEVYHGDRERGYVSAYSISAGPAGQIVEEAWPPVAEREFIRGGFVWAAFDYKGEPRPFGWPVINCHYGFMDICGFPKDSYYYYKAWWTNEPVLHLFPHWNWAGKEGQEIPVWVHSNCDEVELFLNGVSLGRQAVNPLHHLEWKVKYAPGRLVAKGFRKGAALEAVRETVGEPAAIRLTADRSTLAADNADLAVVTVEIVDAQGRVVPDASNKVTFTLTGPAKLIGVGNGDPSSHEPDKADSRSAFNGLAQALVQTIAQGGEIVLTAQSPQLASAGLTLSSR